MRRKKFILALLALIYCAVGASIGFAQRGDEGERVSNLLLGIATAVCTYSWCRTDYLAAPTGVGSYFWAGMFSPVGLPVFLIRRRGAKAGGLAFAKAIGYYICISLGLEACRYLGGAASGA